MSSDSGDELQPSRLGTKKYWDEIYDEELTNYNDFGDEGEVWFGQDTVDKMVEWTTTNLPIPASVSLSPSIIEIGTGNANLLIALVDAGYAPGRMAGADYSKDAIRLAKSVAARHDAETIELVVNDFLRDPLPKIGVEGVEDGWDLVLDKGTYDAMALMDKNETGSRPCDAYPERIAAIVKPGGYFLITSCNFTHEELLRSFADQKTRLVYHSQIDHPSISFGGKKGNTYCTVAFRKAS